MTTHQVHESELLAWEKRTALPLLITSVVFVLLLTVPVLDPGDSNLVRDLLYAGGIAIWTLFLADFLVRYRLAKEKSSFVTSRLPDLCMVAFPALRPLKVLRLLSVGEERAKRSVDRLVIDASRAVGASAILVVYLAAVGVLDAERGAKGSNINSFGDAVWWSCTTITTVGYGDRYPVTWEGRVIAVALMVIGVALLGLLTASIAAWAVHQAAQAALHHAQALAVEAAKVGSDGQKRIDQELADVLVAIKDLDARLTDIQRRAAT